jgi:hypothetical protein
VGDKENEKEKCVCESDPLATLPRFSFNPENGSVFTTPFGLAAFALQQTSETQSIFAFEFVPPLPSADTVYSVYIVDAQKLSTADCLSY